MVLLALRNVIRRKNRAFVAVVITMVTMFIFTLIWNTYSVIQSGYTLNESRMGADIVIYPASVDGDSQDILYSGVAEMAYLDEAKLMQKLPQDMIAEQTNEFYIQTLPTADCCTADSTLRVVGIDVDTDFIIKPWITKELNGKFDRKDMIIGCDIQTDLGDRTTVMNTLFDIRGELYQTGSSLDQSVFIDIDQAREMAKKTFSSNYFDDRDPDELITCCMIRLKDGVSPEEFTESFHAESLGAKVAVVSEERQKLYEQNQGLLVLMGIFWLATLLVSVLALASLYQTIIRERKREIGYLRAIGMKRSHVIGSLLMEVGIQGGIGGVLGAAIGCGLTGTLLGSLQKICLIPVGEWTGAVMAIHFIGSVAVAIVISLVTTLPSAIRAAGTEVQDSLSEGEMG